MEYPSKIDCPTGIYKIENTINGKVYIGQTSINFLGRWKGHVNSLNKNKHENILLQRAWNKYGPKAFKATIEVYIPAYLNEQEFWDKLDTEERKILLLYPSHYNLMEAGEDRMIFSEESKKRASLSAKNRKISEAERQIWEEKRIAATKSVKAREKRSIAHKALWADPEQRKIFEAAYKRPETFKKKSKSIKASWTANRRKQQVKLNLEMHADPEFKEKHRASIKAAHAGEEGFKKYSKAMEKGWIKRKANMLKPEYQAKEAERIRKIKETKAKNKLARGGGFEPPIN